MTVGLGSEGRRSRHSLFKKKFGDSDTIKTIPSGFTDSSSYPPGLSLAETILRPSPVPVLVQREHEYWEGKILGIPRHKGGMDGLDQNVKDHEFTVRGILPLLIYACIKIRFDTK